MDARRPPESEARPPDVDCEALGVMLETVSDAIYAVDGDWRIVIFNAAAERYFDMKRETALGRTLWEVAPQSVGTEFERACRGSMAQRTPCVFESQSMARPGRIVELKITPLPDGGLAVALSDVTERRRADSAVRAERDRTAEILESISDAFYAVDGEWRFTYVNRVAEHWWGRRREDLIGKIFQEEFPDAVDSRAFQAHLVAARERRVVRLETISSVLGRWIDVSIFPTERGLSVYFRDISERKLAEERQRLLVNELNHRVKNSLAMVQGLARQTLTGPRSLDEARAAFTERLLALAAAHDVITAERWSGAGITELIERSVLAHVEPPERLKLDGAAMNVSPKMALSLSLAFHELVTNALKYGALSTPGGEIRLRWRVEDGMSQRRLRIIWRECGGPPVAPPARKGFGSRLIERALAADLGGAVRLEFAPDGVVCEIEAELPDGDWSVAA